MLEWELCVDVGGIDVVRVDDRDGVGGEQGGEVGSVGFEEGRVWESCSHCRYAKFQISNSNSQKRWCRRSLVLVGFHFRVGGGSGGETLFRDFHAADP